MVAQMLSREKKIFLTISFSSYFSRMLESEWFSDVPNKKLVTMCKVTFSLKDVGIVKDLREKWPRAGKRFAQRYTAG